MRRFLINCLLFFFLFAGLFILFQYGLTRQKSKIMVLPENISKVFLGNSIVRYGVNDTIVDSSYNFGRGLERWELVYAKLKLLHDNNPGLDTVYIGFDDTILFNETVEKTSGHPFLVDEFSLSDILHNIWDGNFDRIFFVSHAYDFIKLRPILYSYFRYIDFKEMYLGSYQVKHGSRITEEMKIPTDPPEGYYDRRIPELNIYYLDKIVEYSKNNNIKLTFISFPKFYNSWYRTHYRKLHAERYPDIPLIDWMEKEMPADFFYDNNHLNYNGAIQLSKELEEFLQENK